MARASAIADVAGPQAGLAALDAIEPRRVAFYQSFHAARAELLARAGQTDAALLAYGTAMTLSQDPAIRAYLEARRSQLLS